MISWGDGGGFKWGQGGRGCCEVSKRGRGVVVQRIELIDERERKKRALIAFKDFSCMGDLILDVGVIVYFFHLIHPSHAMQLFIHQFYLLPYLILPSGFNNFLIQISHILKKILIWCRVIIIITKIALNIYESNHVFIHFIRNS